MIPSQPSSPEARDHRCSGCDHRWRGGPAAPNEWTGAELCGDCWRRVQPILHRPEASDQQRAYDLSEAILRCWSAGQPYVSEAARADMIAIIHAHDAAVRAEQAASDTARIKELEQALREMVIEHKHLIAEHIELARAAQH